MNEKVRQGVREVMKSRGLTHQDLSGLTGIARPNISRLLGGSVGTVPDNWQKVLDALGLELVVVPKGEGKA